MNPDEALPMYNIEKHLQLTDVKFSYKRAIYLQHRGVRKIWKDIPNDKQENRNRETALGNLSIVFLCFFFRRLIAPFAFSLTRNHGEPLCPRLFAVIRSRQERDLPTELRPFPVEEDPDDL